MEVKNYSEDKFETFAPLHLGDIIHTESDLYFVTYKGQNKIFKKLYLDFGEQFSNKLYTLSSLIDNKNNIGIEEIVFPEQIVTISKNIKGFMMPYIKNINFTTYLSMKNKTIKDKIECFKQINEILLKMKKVRERLKNNFYVNDLHEGNILFNVDTKKINLVDIDSCRILNNEPFASKFLSSTALAAYFPKKYIVNPSESSGYIIPDQNSDIYCYALMILNLLYKDKFYNLDIKTVYDYFEYLKKIGFSNEFIEKFSLPFSEGKDNEFLGDYLDEIDEEKYKKASFPEFKEYVLKKY